MAWLLLFLAGSFEMTWPVCLRFSNGFTKALPTVLALGASLASFVLLSRALKFIPVGVAYAVWTGIGITGTTVIGIWLLEEQPSLRKLGCILLILFGIIGLKLTVDAETEAPPEQVAVQPENPG